MNNEAISATSERPAWPVLALAATTFLLVLLPLALVTWPPLQDLPNHLARIFVLGLSPDHPIRQAYAPDWRPLPNLITDLLLLALEPILPLALAAKLMVALIALAWIGAPLALHFALYRRWALTPLLAAPFVFNQALQTGFLNFTLGSALSVLCLAGWILLAHRRRSGRLAAAIGMGLLLYFSHLFALSVFVISVTLWEVLSRQGTNRKAGWLLITSIIAVPVALYLLGNVRGTPGDTFMAFQDWTGPIAVLVGRLGQLIAFPSTGPLIGIASLAFLLLTAAGSLAFFPHRLDRAVGWLCVLLLALFLLMPAYILGGSNADWRMLAPLILIVVGWLRLDLGRLFAAAFAVTTTALTVAATMVTAATWQSGETTYRQLEAIAVQIPSSEPLYYAVIGLGRNGLVPGSTSALHLHGLLVIERETIDPALFALPGQQPFKRLSPFREAVAGLPLVADHLDEIDWPQVRASFGKIVLVSGAPLETPPGLALVARSGPFALYDAAR